MDKRTGTTQNEKSSITEAVVLLAGQAQRTLAHELRKAQNSPNPPFFLKLKRHEDGKIDEEVKKDQIELQNFAEVLAETMAQLLKQAEQTLLTKLKNTQSADQKNSKVDDPKQRQDEVRNFTKVFAETRAKLVDDVKDLVRELRKDHGDENNSPSKQESLFSILGVDDVALDLKPRNGFKRGPTTSNYNPDRDPSKKSRISPPKPKPKAVSRPPPSSMRDEVCYICEETGHWAFQCTKPDTRRCFICNESGHFKTDCKKYLKMKQRRSRSRSRERSYSSERSRSRDRSRERSSNGSSYSGSRR